MSNSKSKSLKRSAEEAGLITEENEGRVIDKRILKAKTFLEHDGLLNDLHTLSVKTTYVPEKQTIITMFKVCPETKIIYLGRVLFTGDGSDGNEEGDSGELHLSASFDLKLFERAERALILPSFYGVINWRDYINNWDVILSLTDHVKMIADNTLHLESCSMPSFLTFKQKPLYEKERKDLVCPSCRASVDLKFE